MKAKLDLYKTEGRIQAIARSRAFFATSMTVVLLNTIYMALDAEFNDALIQDATFAFQFGENSFCTFFSIELAIRFAAYQRKKDSFKDNWFVFDLFLVTLQVSETWILRIVMIWHQMDQLTFLKAARLLRLARLGRLVRMLV